MRARFTASPHAPAKRPAAAAGARARASRARGGASRGAGGAPARVRVAAGALAAAGPPPSPSPRGRRGFGAAGARGGAAVSAVAVTGKATRSIDEMDMDPEHVTFASQRRARPQVRLRENPPRFFPRARPSPRGSARRATWRAPTPRKAAAFPTAFTTASHAPANTSSRSRAFARVRRADSTRARGTPPFARVRSRARVAGTPPVRRSARASTARASSRAVTRRLDENSLPRANPPATEAPRRPRPSQADDAPLRPSPPSTPQKSPTRRHTTRSFPSTVRSGSGMRRRRVRAPTSTTSPRP